MGKKKIVMFEADKFLSGMYEICVRKKGLEIKTFRHPPESVIDLLLREKPDLISTGAVMPHMDGFHLIEKVKSDPRTKDIPIVMLTSLGQKEDIERAKQLGANEYLIKARYTPSAVVEMYQKYL